MLELIIFLYNPGLFFGLTFLFSIYPMYTMSKYTFDLINQYLFYPELFEKSMSEFVKIQSIMESFSKIQYPVVGIPSPFSSFDVATFFIHSPKFILIGMTSFLFCYWFSLCFLGFLFYKGLHK